MKTYTIRDIDCVQGLEDGTLLIFLTDGIKITTDSFMVTKDGELEFGYIYS